MLFRYAELNDDTDKLPGTFSPLFFAQAKTLHAQAPGRVTTHKANRNALLEAFTLTKGDREEGKCDALLLRIL